MSWSITDADVQAVAEVDPTITSLAPWIDMAVLIVEEELEPLGTLSDARLKLISINLAAHFLKADRDPLAASEGAGGVSQSNLISGGNRLDATPYGQKALVLDTTGTLAAMNEGKPKPTVGARWMGVAEL